MGGRSLVDIMGEQVIVLCCSFCGPLNALRLSRAHSQDAVEYRRLYLSQHQATPSERFAEFRVG